MGFSVKKAAQVVAYLLIKNEGKSLGVLKVAKLLYLADRESLNRYGFSITDDDFVSMPHGPANSRTLNRIRGESFAQSKDWDSLIKDREDHKIGLRKTQISVDDLDELSRADIGCIDEVWTAHSPKTDLQLVEWTHDPDNVPEWEDPNGSSSPIPYKRVFQALGVENIDAQVEEIENFRSIDRLFERLSS